MSRKGSTQNFELSYQQQDIAFNQLLNVNSPVWNIGGYIKIENANLERIYDSLNYLISKCDFFYLYLIKKNNNLYQRFFRNTFNNISLIDFSKKKDFQRTLEKLIRKEFSKAFDIFKFPLYKFILVKNLDDYYLVGIFHHIIIDGLGISLFISNFWNNYLGVKEKNDFLDKTSFRRYLNRTPWKASKNFESFWLEKLTFFPEKLLPYAPFPRKSDEVIRKKINFSEAIMDKIDFFTQENNVSSSDFFMGLILFSINKHFGKKRILLGVPLSNRNSKDASVIGMLMQMIPVSFEIKPSDSFLEFVKKIRLLLYGYYKNRKVDLKNFKRINKVAPEILEPDVIFSYNNIFYGDKFISKLNWVQPTSQSPFIFITVAHNPIDNESGCRNLELVFDVRKDFYKHFLKDNFFENIESFTNKILKNPLILYKEIEFLNKNQIKEILSDFNCTDFKLPNKSFIDYFKYVVVRKQDKSAIFFDDKEMSYKKLNDLSDMAAGSLLKNGIKRNVVVAVLMKRNSDLVIAILAIMRIGCVFLPLDPDLPEDRLSFMLSDSNSKLLITDTINNSLFHLFQGTVVNFQDLISENCSLNPQKIKKYFTKPSDIAYIIYTSGSTGTPKGVMVRHNSLLNFLISLKNIINISEEDKFLSITTISFDIFYLELLLPLLVGAECHIATTDEKNNMELLSKKILKSNINFMQGTPTFWRFLLDSKWDGKSDLNIIVGGERLSSNLASELALKNKNVWNMYGPTETTIWSTYFKINKNSDQVFIGKPIGNTKIYILGANMELLPVGVPGDIYIGGVGVSLGYVNNIALTNEKFVVNPFSINQEKIYKTGDVGRLDFSGNIEFIGRRDNQVKIRGYRIELNEIDITILKFKNIKECASVILPDDKICCYFTASIVVNYDDVRKHCIKYLPKYMIPNYFVQIGYFERTIGGKINKNLLPEPVFSSKNQESEVLGELKNKDFHNNSKKKIEQELVYLWSNVLDTKLKKINIEDSFLSLGGTSLEAFDLIARVEKKFGILLSIDVFLMGVTISDMAIKIVNFKNTNKF